MHTGLITPEVSSFVLVHPQIDPGIE